MARPQSENMAKVQKAVTRECKPMSIADACKKYDVKENSVYKSSWYRAWKESK